MGNCCPARSKTKLSINLCADMATTTSCCCGDVPALFLNASYAGNVPHHYKLPMACLLLFFVSVHKVHFVILHDIFSNINIFTGELLSWKLTINLCVDAATAAFGVNFSTWNVGAWFFTPVLFVTLLFFGNCCPAIRVNNNQPVCWCSSHHKSHLQWSVHIVTPCGDTWFALVAAFLPSHEIYFLQSSRLIFVNMAGFFPSLCFPATRVKKAPTCMSNCVSRALT